jgi:PTS system nitrogen regulatory IIA component
MKVNKKIAFKKYLSQKEVAQLLDIPEVTIQRWEHQGKIPFKVIRKNIYFKTTDILNWAKSHNLPVKPLDSLSVERKTTQYSIRKAVEMGNIYYDIEGNDIFSVFSNALGCLSFLTANDKEMLLNELLYREELTSTGVGKGVALPHTRKTFELKLKKPHIPIFFLKNPIDFHAMDGIPVFVLIMLFTTTVQDHLKLLSKIGFLLQNEEFIKILRERNVHRNLISKISEIEKASGHF